MNPRATWIACAVAGVVAFACSWGFGRIPGMVACGPSFGLGPIIAFELARTPADVAALFGTEPCTAALVAAQKTGLLLDGLGFIPAYTAFLILATAAAGVRGIMKWAMIAAFAVAGTGDEIEGFILRTILDSLPGTQAQTGALFWAVHVKFALLGIGTLAIAAQLLAVRRPVAGLAGAAVGAGALIALQGFVGMPSPMMMTGFAVGWIGLLLTALVGAVRPTLFLRAAFSRAHAARPPDPAAPSA